MLSQFNGAVVVCFGFIQTIARHGLVAQTRGTSISGSVITKKKWEDDV